jgi:glycosyltransferase involved in cell wall biosynthesis
MTPGTPQDRQVPHHEATELTPKRHDVALVIPVINEGTRIRDQLRRIAACAPATDTVIADGGSTDGSLDLPLLREVGVRALLVKRDTGRLGAQLRMAYAWCLDQGYRGIVTVDGNGKDGVEAIDRFVAALDEGFDYVQGSRYVPGGRAVNTPLDRWIAGRLIHAPLLSLAAHHRYTDTTNGFRAYSARYLDDPRVAPFRAVFDRYALLFYLTVRAGQLGYRTCEIPVTRSYPPGEKAPTKISGLRGRLAMMGELIGVVAGRYRP